MASASANGRAAPPTDSALPNSNELEMALLGAQLARPDLLDHPDTAPDPVDFYYDRHRLLGGGMRHLRETVGDFDVVTLEEHLRKNKTLDEVGGATYLTDLMQAAWYAEKAPLYAKVIRQRAVERLFISRCEQAARILRDGSGDLEQALAALGDADSIAAGLGRPRFAFTDGADLIREECRQEYLITDVLPAGQVGYAAGAAKAGKTNACVLDGALSLAAGVPYLGYFDVPKQESVGVVTGESGRPNVIGTLRRQMRRKGITEDHIRGRLWVCTDLPDLSKPDDLRHLRRLAIKHGWRALYLDPRYLLGLIPAAHASNLTGAGEALAPLARMSIELGLTIVLVDHSRKNLPPSRQYEPLELVDITGSGGAEFARFWLLVNRSDPFDAVGAPGQSDLWFSIGGNAGHGGVYHVRIEEGRHDDPGGRDWVVTVRNPSVLYAERDAAKREEKDRGEGDKVSRAAEALERNKERLLDAIRKFSDPQTKTVIKKVSGVNSSRADAAWAVLEEEGAITSVPIVKHKQQQQGWIIAEGHAPSKRRDSEPEEDTALPLDDVVEF